MEYLDIAVSCKEGCGYRLDPSDFPEGPEWGHLEDSLDSLYLTGLREVFESIEKIPLEFGRRGDCQARSLQQAMQDYKSAWN